MKKIGEYVVNRKQVCKICDIITHKNKTYYSLIPVGDKTLNIKVPIDSKLLRDLITREDLEKLLLEIPRIDAINNSEKMIENQYKELMKSGTHEDLVKVIKTTYLRNKEREENNKKLSDKDNEYFNRAEKYFYNELSVVLDMSFDETKEYVHKRLEEIESSK